MKTLFSQQPSPQSLAGRDRVLLYTRGMDINPEEGVSLALQSLRRAGDNAAPARVMEELFALLRENAPPPRIEDADGNLLVSTPPLNRSSVVPKGVEPLSFSMAVARWSRSMWAALKDRINGIKR